MGVKEEKAPFRLVKGYSSQLLPNQTAGGRCLECKKKVWCGSSKQDGKDYQGVIYVHYSCQVISKLQAEISQIIPVPQYKA